jgi:NADH dehydrogenase (ubiquinone) Fe-S protein 4
MASALRLTRQIRPVRSVFVRYNSSKPPPPPTVHHIPLSGEKTIPAADQTTTNVPAPTPPIPDRAPIPADIVSGAPEDLHRRPVRIYRPSKSAMQSGLHGNLFWRIDWDVRPEDNRWEHPVMFWAARCVLFMSLT